MKQALIFNLCSSSNISNDFSVGSKIVVRKYKCNLCFCSNSPPHSNTPPHHTSGLEDCKTPCISCNLSWKYSKIEALTFPYLKKNQKKKKQQNRFEWILTLLWVFPLGDKSKIRPALHCWGRAPGSIVPGATWRKSLVGVWVPFGAKWNSLT